MKKRSKRSKKLTRLTKLNYVLKEYVDSCTLLVISTWKLLATALGVVFFCFVIITGKISPMEYLEYILKKIF